MSHENRPQVGADAARFQSVSAPKPRYELRLLYRFTFHLLMILSHLLQPGNYLGAVDADFVAVAGAVGLPLSCRERTKASTAVRFHLH